MGPLSRLPFLTRTIVRNSALAACALLCAAALPAQTYPQYQVYPGNPQYPQYAQPQPAYPQSYAAPSYTQAYPQQPQAYPQQPQQAYNYPAPAQQSYPQQPAYAAPQEYAPQPYGAPQSQPKGLDASRLEQLVAPIALYPDALVAQVLAAATYPAQVAEADRWLAAQGAASAYDIAGGADSQPWDPSVKALTAFPQVLAELDRNINWTTDLGNAYFNQPQDVLQAVQILRQRAQTAGTLQNSPQETVQYQSGAIELAPPTPQVVYVPTYNPWAVYGQPISPYPGFSLLGEIGSVAGSVLSSAFGASPLQFGLGIAMTAFDHTPFGAIAWGIDWLAHELFFGNSGYATHSASVVDWGLPHGGARFFGNRGYVAPSRGGYGGYGTGYGYNRVPRQAYTGSYNRGALEAYNRAPSSFQRQPQAIRPAYNYDQRAGMNYGQRTGIPSSAGGARSFAPQSPGLQSGYRAPNAIQRGSFTQRASNEPSRTAFSGYGSAPKSGGFHLFGGGSSQPKFSQPKFSQPKFSQPKFSAPKFSSKSSGGGHFSSHSSSHSGGGKHRG